MSDFNSGIYFTECESVAACIVSEAIECLQENGEDISLESIQDHIGDHGLDHAAIDGHEYVIYYRYHLPILQYSSNSDYMIANIGEADHVLKESGLDGLHQALAFWAFYADVSEYLDDAISEQLEALEADSE